MRLKTIAREFRHHFPFTVFSAALGLIVVVFLNVLLRTREPSGPSEYFRQLFHLFHPLHVLVSAVATTAMFWRFDRNLIKAIIVGAAGSLGICGLSDIFLPWIGGWVIGVHMHLHVCIVEHPLAVVPFALLGIVTGFITADKFLDRRSTIFSHSGHVLISTMASLFYFVSFGFVLGTENAYALFILVILVVIIPCCTSDILFPLAAAKRGDRHGHEAGDSTSH